MNLVPAAGAIQLNTAFKRELDFALNLIVYRLACLSLILKMSHSNLGLYIAYPVLDSSWSSSVCPVKRRTIVFYAFSKSPSHSISYKLVR